MNSEKLNKSEQIVLDCLNEMYAKSTPRVSFNNIIKKSKSTNKRVRDSVKGFYEKHTLSEKKYDEIRDKYRKLLKPRDRNRLDFDLLCYGPKVQYK